MRAWKKVVTSILLAASIVGVSASAALAWHVDTRGTAFCAKDSGFYEVDYYGKNWSSQHTATVTSRLGTYILAGTTEQLMFKEFVPGTSTSVSLETTSSWAGTTETDPDTITVYMEGTCVKPTTSFTIDTRMPYFHDVVTQEPVGTTVSVQRYCHKFAVRFTEPGGSVFTEIVPSEYRTLLKVRDEQGTILVSKIGKYAGCKH